MTLHPAVAGVRRGVRRVLADVEPGVTVVVACSGGADSMALLAGTVFEARKAGWRVVGATIDHGLQDASAELATRVVGQMAVLGADETFSARVHVEGAGMGPEAAAREARYAVLEEIAQRLDAPVVLLGHTRDDQAETVLMGLTRGSGGRSLAGMRRGFGRYRRPLLDVSRADTVASCRAEGIDFWSDPHNDDPAYTRSRIRTRVLPLLEQELGPGVAETLARTADQLRLDMEHLDDEADALLARASGPEGLDLTVLTGAPAPIRRRVLRLAALAAGAPASELFHDHVLAMEALVTDWRGQKWIDLPGHLRFRRLGELLVFEHPR